MIITIIFSVLAIVFFIFAGNFFADKTEGGGLLLIFGIMFLLIAITNDYHEGKESGQVDALTGHIYYQLKTNPDSTKEWVFIEKK